MADAEPPFDPSNYPPETEVGHARYRLSWWEKPGQLAGIELWPDNEGTFYADETPQSYYVVRSAKPPRLTDTDTRNGARFGFRRRCAWCGVVLRGWQLNMCRRCKHAAQQEWGGPPCRYASRWDDLPDTAPQAWNNLVWRGHG